MWRHVLMAAVISGCAATPGKLREATTARYQANPQALLRAAMAAVEDSEYEIVQRGDWAFAAVPIEYLSGPNGRDNVLATAYVVRVEPSDAGFRFTVTPRGYAYARGLTQDVDVLDASVDNRIDELTVAIHERASGMLAR
ncbi:MAG: hypothetical protein ACM31C_28010 [Acidobacteriota bacterium]